MKDLNIILVKEPKLENPSKYSEMLEKLNLQPADAAIEEIVRSNFEHCISEMFPSQGAAVMTMVGSADIVKVMSQYCTELARDKDLFEGALLGLWNKLSEDSRDSLMAHLGFELLSNAVLPMPMKQGASDAKS